MRKRQIMRWCGIAGMGALMFVGAAAVSAVPATESIDDMIACRAIYEPAARLVCYDRAANALAHAPWPKDAAVSAAVPPPPPPPPAAAPQPLDPKKTFGLPEAVVAEKEVTAGTRARSIDRVDAHLVGLARPTDGRIAFTLDNGQVWRQLLPEGDLLAKLGDAVTISRGWLGSYWLKLPSGRNCKVDRVH